MKKHTLLIILGLSVLLYSCKDDNLELLNSIIPEDEKINLKTDTFHLDIETINADSIPFKNYADEMLLGIFRDSLYGSTSASILTQLNCPNNWYLPSDTVAGSVKLILRLQLSSTAYYTRHKEKIKIKVYEMDKQSLSLSLTSPIYYNTTSPLVYTDVNATPLGYREMNYIENDTIDIPMSNAFRDTLLAISVDPSRKHFFNDDAAFINNVLNGIYLNLESGNRKTTMMKLKNIEMILKFKYKSNPSGSEIRGTKVFASTKEVRRVNCIKRDFTLPSNLPVSDSIAYINSPAGRNIALHFPLKRIKDSLGVTVLNGVAMLGDKKLSVNNCFLNLEVIGYNTTKLSPPSYLLLVKKSQVENFFNTIKLPDGINGILGTYSSDTKSYQFNLNFYLANELKKDAMPNVDELVILPVDQTFDSSGNTTAIVQMMGLSGASFLTKKSSSPLKLNILVSGF